MKSIAARLALLALAGVAVPALADEAAEEGTSYALTAQWDGKYMFQGRDVLGGDGGLASVTADLTHGGFYAGLWGAKADSNEYGEVDAWVGYGHELGPVSASLTLSRFEYTDTGDGDNEVAAGLSGDVAGLFTLSCDYAWSTEIEGGFAEVTVSREYGAFEERLTLAPYVTQALDDGYASVAHDGRNHLQVGVDASYALDDSVSVLLSVAKAFAQEDVERDGLGDESWASVGLSASF